MKYIKKYKPTEATAARVEYLATIGMPVHIMGYLIDHDNPLSGELIFKHYKDALALGKAKAHEAVGGNLFRMATGEGKEALTAAIFYTKTQMGWSETHNINIGPTSSFLDVLTKAQINKNELTTGDILEGGIGSRNEGGCVKGVPSTEISSKILESPKEDSLKLLAPPSVIENVDEEIKN